MAFHAEHGPFAGFLIDLQTYRAYFNQPVLLTHSRDFFSDSVIRWMPFCSTRALMTGGIIRRAHCQTAGLSDSIRTGRWPRDAELAGIAVAVFRRWKP